MIILRSGIRPSPEQIGIQGRRCRHPEEHTPKVLLDLVVLLLPALPVCTERFASLPLGASDVQHALSPFAIGGLIKKNGESVGLSPIPRRRFLLEIAA